jgi:hypothetical protein
MQTPEVIVCEYCGSDAPVVKVRATDRSGQWSYWPKSSIREKLFYVFLQCPKCGELEQCFAPAGRLPPK